MTTSTASNATVCWSNDRAARTVTRERQLNRALTSALVTFRIDGERRRVSNDGRAHPLAPLGVGDADDSTICDARMRAVDLFDLNRRDLLAAGLDDVHRHTAEEPVAVGFVHRDVARAEPAVHKRRGGFLRASPVFDKDLRSPHQQLAGVAIGHVASVVINDTDLDVRERLADRSGHPMVERVRKGDADFGHAVPLEEGLAGYVLPPSQRRYGKGGRTGNHEPRLRRAPRPSSPVRISGGFPRRDQSRIDRRDRHEQCERSRGQTIPRGVCIEAPGRLAQRPRCQRAQRDIHDAMHMVEWEHEQDPVIGRPGPHFEKTFNLCP
jgi:hypothetical protein